MKHELITPNYLTHLKKGFFIHLEKSQNINLNETAHCLTITYTYIKLQYTKNPIMI